MKNITRHSAKKQHEESILNEALTLLNGSRGTSYNIIDRPDPPDGIASDGKNQLWIEIVDAYRSEDEAREQWTYALSNEKPDWQYGSLVTDPDRRSANSIIVNKLKKFAKSTYETWAQKLGLGVLIVCEQDSLFSETTLLRLQEIIDDPSYQEFLKREYPKPHFKEVYLQFRLSCWKKNGLVRIYPSWGPYITPDLD